MERHFAFARTQGSDATTVDLSKNRLNDHAATEEITRLVKNYSSFAANAFISELLLAGNNIGRLGAPRARVCEDRARAQKTPQENTPRSRTIARAGWSTGATKLIPATLRA